MPRDVESYRLYKRGLRRYYLLSSASTFLSSSLSTSSQVFQLSNPILEIPTVIFAILSTPSSLPFLLRLHCQTLSSHSPFAIQHPSVSTMRCSIFKAAVVAIIGLGSLLSGANGSPRLNPSTREVSSSELLKRVTAVVDPTKDPHGYKIEHGDLTGDMGQKYTVKDAAGKMVDVFGVNPEGSMMAVANARNVDDTTAKANKLPLRGLLLGTWHAVTGKSVKDIKVIAWKTIVNNEIRASMDKAFAHLKTTAKSATVRPTDTEAFKELTTGNVAGVGLGKMLAQYEGMTGRHVNSITINKQWSYEMFFYLS